MCVRLTISISQYFEYLSTLFGRDLHHKDRNNLMTLAVKLFFCFRSAQRCWVHAQPCWCNCYCLNYLGASENLGLSKAQHSDSAQRRLPATPLSSERSKLRIQQNTLPCFCRCIDCVRGDLKGAPVSGSAQHQKEDKADSEQQQNDPEQGRTLEFTAGGTAEILPGYERAAMAAEIVDRGLFLVGSAVLRRRSGSSRRGWRGGVLRAPCFALLAALPDAQEDEYQDHDPESLHGVSQSGRVAFWERSGAADICQ